MKVVSARLMNIRTWGPEHFLVLDILYAVVLVVLLVGRQAHYLGINDIHDPIGGIVPIAVPWYGALGAVTVSLYGVIDHADQWNARFNFWHISRPLFGAVLGTVAYLIFVGVLNATGSTPSIVLAKRGADQIPYLVIAFAVGFREATFRALIQKVIDTLLSPGDSAKEPVVAIGPSPLDFGVVAAGGSDDKVITVANTGTGALVIHGTAPAPGGISVDNPAFAVVNDVASGATINAGASVALTVRYTPGPGAPTPGTLTLRCNAGTFLVPLHPGT